MNTTSYVWLSNAERTTWPFLRVFSFEGAPWHTARLCRDDRICCLRYPVLYAPPHWGHEMRSPYIDRKNWEPQRCKFHDENFKKLTSSGAVLALPRVSLIHRRCSARDPLVRDTRGRPTPLLGVPVSHNLDDVGRLPALVEGVGFDRSILFWKNITSFPQFESIV